MSNFVEQQIKYILPLFFLSFSFGRIAQLVAHSLHKREGRFEFRAQHLTEFFFLLVYDDVLLACDFYISFHSSSSFFVELR